MCVWSANNKLSWILGDYIKILKNTLLSIMRDKKLNWYKIPNLNVCNLA